MKSRTTSEIKEELSKPLEEKKPLSIQAMRMLVHVEMRRRQKPDEPQLNCIVIDGGNKEKYESFVENMKKMAAEVDSPTRFQVIIKQDAHYTAMDVQLSKEEGSPRDRGEPRRGVGGRLVIPGGEGSDECLLDGVLGGREVRTATDEGAQDAGYERAQRDVVHR